MTPDIEPKAYTTFKKKVIEPGARFGSLKVWGELDERSPGGHRMYRAQCDCGNLITVSSNKLRTGHTKSCGCQSKAHARSKQRAEQVLTVETIHAHCGFCDGPFSYEYSTGRKKRFCEDCVRDRRRLRKQGRLKTELEPEVRREVRSNLINVAPPQPEKLTPLKVYERNRKPVFNTKREGSTYVTSPNGVEMELMSTKVVLGEEATFRTAENQMVRLMVVSARDVPADERWWEQS